MDNDLIYAYCILNSLPREEEDVTKAEEINILQINEYYVVYKLVSPDDFSEENLKLNLRDTIWLERNKRHHITTILAVMKRHTVIPLRFGTIFPNREYLGKFVTDYSASLFRNFQSVSGKEEWAVKIYCNKRVLREKMFELSDELVTLEKHILESSPGKAFLLNRKKTELIEQEVILFMKKKGQQCLDEYKTICTQSYLNNLFPRELTGRQDDMILNANFFITKENVGLFVYLVNRQENEFHSLGFSFEVTGPWPPFSFVLWEKTCN